MNEDLKKEVEEGEGEPEYFFSVEIEGEESRSKILTYMTTIDLYFEDENGNPLDDVDYIITLSDGTKKQGKFQAGHAKIDNAPFGKFKIEVEGYEL